MSSVMTDRTLRSNTSRLNTSLEITKQQHCNCVQQTKHLMPLTQCRRRRHQPTPTTQASSPAQSATWPPWPATPGVLGCTTKHLARTVRQFQHGLAPCDPCVSPLHGSSVSPQNDTCVERNSTTTGRTNTYTDRQTDRQTDTVNRHTIVTRLNSEDN